MKIINRIVESEMTASEQVELMRLEDEVSDARDQLDFAMNDDNSGHDELDRLCDIAQEDLYRCERNLNNYIDSITKIVMDRIVNAQCDGLEEEWYRVKQGL